MALTAILSVGSKLLGGGSKLARTANVGRKLLGIKGKKNKETQVEDNESSAIIVRPSTSLIPESVSVSSRQSTTETQSNPETGKSTLEEDVEYIKNKTLEIDKLLKSSFAQQKKDAANLRKLRANARRRKTEDRFESGSGGRVGKAKEKVKKPFSNIFEGIKNYLTAIVLGFIAVKLVPLLPKLIEFAKFIAPVVEFITDFAGLILNGLVTFIDWGYKAYDATAGFIKKIGGEDAAKVFDKFSGAFTLFANLAIVAGLAAARAGDGPDFGKGKGRKTGIGKGRKGPTPISGRGKGRQRTTTSRAARKYFDRFGRDAAEKRFGKDAIKSLGGKYGRSGVTNAFRKGATAVADKIGGKAGIKVLSSLGKIGKFIKVPVIGGIISAVISLMSGEPIGKAIFSGIGTVLGGALGSLIPIPVVGTILGGFIGEYVGDLLGTLFFGGGIKEAGAKLGKDILGIFTGVGKGAKAIFEWVFGGGLFTLLANIGGGVLRFVEYILNPGGLLFDVLKTSAGAIKFVVGGVFNLIKGIGGGALQLATYLLSPGGLIWDLLKMGGSIAKVIFDFATSIVGNVAKGAVEGTKKAAGGFLDALTLNVFDFDKQNEVEKKEEGGIVGLTREEKEKKLKSDKIIPTVKSSELSISSVGATLRGSGNTGEKVKSLYKPAGVAALAQLGNKLREVPIVGEAMASAVRIALGIKPDSRTFNTIGANLINFASLDNIDGIASSPGELAQVATKMETGGEVDFISDVESLDNSAKALNIGNFLKAELQRLDLTAVGEEKEKKQEDIFDKLFGLFKPKKDPNKKDDKTPGASPTTDLVPGASGASGGATSSKFGTPEQKKLLDAIAFAEGTTGSYGTLYGGKVIPELAAGEMTIAEVLKMQKTKMYKGESVYGSGYDSNATGRYQFMSYVLEEEIGIQGIDPSEKFTPELQDRIILNRISRMRGVTAALLAEEGISDKVIDMLAPEFASFPNLIGPDAQGNVGTNTSYYGQGGKTAAEIKKAYGDSTGEASAISIAEPTTPLVPGVVPSSDIQTADPSSTPKGEGSKLAGELGRFLDSKGLGGWGSGTHQHPEHPPWPKESGHSPNSLHYESQGARALDIGGWGPNLFRRKGQSGTDDQTQILSAISEFNSSKGVTPVELLHEGNEPSGHADHVHVAYQGGGLIQKNETDMSKSLRTKMSYDKRSTKVLIQPVITERTITKTKPIPMMSGSSSSGGGVNNTSDRLFAG